MKNKDEPKLIKRLIKMLLNYFTFSVYLRVTIMALLFNTILVVKEIWKNETGESQNL